MQLSYVPSKICHMTSSRDRDDVHDRWKCDRAGSSIEHLEHVIWTHQTDYKSIIHFSISNLGLTFAHSECHPMSQPFLTSRSHVIERKFILDLELIFQFIHIHSDFRISLKIKFLKSFLGHVIFLVSCDYDHVDSYSPMFTYSKGSRIMVWFKNY